MSDKDTLNAILQVLFSPLNSFKLSPASWINADVIGVLEHRVQFNKAGLQLTIAAYKTTYDSQFATKCTTLLPQYMNVTTAEVTEALAYVDTVTNGASTVPTVTSFIAYLSAKRIVRCKATSKT